jgi:hypothetical protein
MRALPYRRSQFTPLSRPSGVSGYSSFTFPSNNSSSETCGSPPHILSRSDGPYLLALHDFTKNEIFLCVRLPELYPLKSPICCHVSPLQPMTSIYFATSQELLSAWRKLSKTVLPELAYLLPRLLLPSNGWDLFVASEFGIFHPFTLQTFRFTNFQKNLRLTTAQISQIRISGMVFLLLGGS